MAVSNFRILLLAISGSLTGCKLFHSTSKVAQAPTAVAPVEDFDATDVAILLPLNFRDAMDVQLGINTTGDGFCNARGFGAINDSSPVFTEDQFNAIKQRVFGLEKSQCAPSDKITAEDESKLIDDNRHVAYYKGLRPEICDYQNWKVVGFRFDPCGNRADFRDAEGKPRALTVDDLAPKGECRAETRLIAQPFVYENQQWRLVDTSFHLLYKVPDLNAVVADLRYLKRIKTEILQGTTPWPEGVTPDPRRHTPHPALRQEMSQCATQGTGRFGKALHRFMSKHNKPELLSGVAWMTSDTAPGVWSFGTQPFENGELVAHTVQRIRKEERTLLQSGKPSPAVEEALAAQKITNLDVEAIKRKSLSETEQETLLDKVLGPDMPADSDCVDSFALELAQNEKYPIDHKHLNPEGYQSHRCPPPTFISIAPWVDYEGLSPDGRKAFSQLPDVDAIKKTPIAEKGAKLAELYLKPVQPGSSKTWGQQLKIFNDILNPQEVSQLGVTHGTHCVTCHLTDNTWNKLRLVLRYPAYMGPNPSANPPPIWKSYLDKAREETNLRNFGYGPGFGLGVSIRVLYEIDDNRNVLNDLFRSVPASTSL